jgi:ubiquinone/menaquinone biosynthesis C-methylase UbiE
MNAPMENHHSYFMENDQEAFRLDIKTDPDAVRDQARWCGIRPGMRVLDAGCGSGKTTSILYDMIQPGGTIVGVDYAQDRINFAEEHYGGNPGIEFRLMDLRQPLDGLGQFDLVWMRFVLEYYLKGAQEIIATVTDSLANEGTLCLMDLDYNCMTHYPIKPKMETVLKMIVHKVMKSYNFDPYVGRKLYTYLYDQTFRNIEVNMMPHHLIYGNLRENDNFNWIKKIEVVSLKAGDTLGRYPGGYEDWLKDFTDFFHDPRRFTYTPLIICTGKKPLKVG